LDDEAREMVSCLQLKLFSDVPRQEFVDANNQMISDVDEDVMQLSRGPWLISSRLSRLPNLNAYAAFKCICGIVVHGRAS
jgi:hypothetical protein